jgi:LysM repeat protein
VLGVTVEELCRWNNIDRDARLHGKMVMQAYVDEKRDLAEARVHAADKTKVLVVGTPEFFDHFEAKNGRTRLVHTVAAGDTIASLAKRYACSVGMLERINHRPRKSSLAAGERIVVYTTRTDALKPTAPQPTAPQRALDVVEPGSDPYEDAPVAKEDLGG